jgi:uncharacterized protein YecE (DUF72 family)
MEIKVGTSGYSFQDWVGPFYPAGIEKGKMLDYYINHFKTVEINSTYYRIPHPAVMANIDKKTPKDFEFMVKTPDIITHKRVNIESKIPEFLECLKPMQDSGKLKGLLAQFPYSFRFSPTNLNYLKHCEEILRPNPLYAEFRNDSWMNRDMYKTLKESQIGYVAVDEPPLPGLVKPELFNTTDIAYIRLHGRNSEKWWNGGALRYDYSYSDKELQEWKDKIEKIKGKADKVFVFFNNCHLGQAVKNARQMMSMLNL